MISFEDTITRRFQMCGYLRAAYMFIWFTYERDRAMDNPNMNLSVVEKDVVL